MPARKPAPAQLGVPAAIWCRADQAALIARVARIAGLMVERAGSPDAGRSSQVAAALGSAVESFDDLRAAIAVAQRGVVLIADAGALSTGGLAQWTQHAELLRSASARGVVIASLSPLPGALAELVTMSPQGAPLVVSEPAGSEGREASERARLPVAMIPRAVRFAEVRGAASGRPPGSTRAMSVECLCSPAQGTLGSRLLDAMDAVSLFMGEPEMVEAAYCGSANGGIENTFGMSGGGGGGVRAIHALPGDTLHNLRGDLTAHLRFAGGRGAVVIASDRSDRFQFRASLIGPAGVTCIEAPGEQSDPDGADLIAEQLRDLIDSSGTGDVEQASDAARVLAMSQSALLSARTGEGERPEMIMRMAGL